MDVAEPVDLEKAGSDGANEIENPGWGLDETASRPKPMSWKKSIVSIYDEIDPKSPNAWLHVLLLALPFAWVAYFEIEKWGHRTTFVLCFMAMIPLQKIFDWGGEKIGSYLEEDAQHLVVVTFSNLIEAALAVILLIKCELRFLQSTLIGVVLLHLLLVPGASFFIQGLTKDQKLHRRYTSLYQSLSMVGVLGVVVPTLFFAALDREDPVAGLPSGFVPLVSDPVRRYILHMSRGISIILLVVYAVSRVYSHNILYSLGINKYDNHKKSKKEKRKQRKREKWARKQLQEQTRTGAGSAASKSSSTATPSGAPPPETPDTKPSSGDSDNTATPSGAQPETTDTKPNSKSPEKALNPWLCVCVLVVAVGLMIPTAEFLVSSIEEVQATSGIQIEWFGLILLPIVSFSADGTVVIWKAFAYLFPKCCTKLAKLRETIKAKSKSLKASLSHSEAGSSGPDVSPSPVQATSASDTTAVNKQGVQKSTVKQPGEEKESPFEAEFAHWRPFDLSIQFMLMWQPLLVLLGWWTDRPFHLLFDYYEVGLLLGACFLVNCVTFDSKTNMSEGLTMIAFYAIIATATWLYPGQPQVAAMLSCPGTVAQATTGHGEL